MPIRLASLFVALLLSSVLPADEAKEPTREEKLSAAAGEHRLRLDFDGETFSGPGWDRLVAEGRAAQFFLLGEEHGIAENAMLAAQLFSVWRKSPKCSPKFARLCQQVMRSCGAPTTRSAATGNSSRCSKTRTSRPRPRRRWGEAARIGERRDVAATI